jgi:hypothetical protein
MTDSVNTVTNTSDSQIVVDVHSVENTKMLSSNTSNLEEINECVKVIKSVIKKCTICLEDIDCIKTNDVIWTPCFDIFHKICITTYINGKYNELVIPCPNCKYDIAVIAGFRDESTLFYPDNYNISQLSGNRNNRWSEMSGTMGSIGEFHIPLPLNRSRSISDLPDLENDDLSDLENDDLSDLENDDLSDLENDDLPDLENDDLPDLENDDLPDLENDDLPDLENDDLPDLESTNVQIIEQNDVVIRHNIPDTEYTSLEQINYIQQANMRLTQSHNQQLGRVRAIPGSDIVAPRSIFDDNFRDRPQYQHLVTEYIYLIGDSVHGNRPTFEDLNQNRQQSRINNINRIMLNRRENISNDDLIINTLLEEKKSVIQLTPEINNIDPISIFNSTEFIGSDGNELKENEPYINPILIAALNRLDQERQLIDQTERSNERSYTREDYDNDILNETEYFIPL